MGNFTGLIILSLIIVVIGIVIWCMKQKHYRDIADGGSGVGTEVTKPNNTNNEAQSN
jgi:hypothetical protein